MSAKRPAGYSGPYTPPSTGGAPGSYMSPTEAAALRQRNLWPAAFKPGQPPGVEVGEIVGVLATGVLDSVNAAIAGSLMVASGATLSRTVYDDLFTVYNETFGAGDSNTTFGTIDIQNNYSYLEGTTTSGITYPANYRVEGVLPTHQHNVEIGTSVTPRAASPTNGFIRLSSTFTYSTGLNYNASDKNESRHLQLIRCVATKSIPSPPVGSIQYVLAPGYLPSEIETLGVVPGGYLIPSGQDVSRSVYSELFNRIGIKFGSGDGSTTFGLPNFLGLFSRGSSNPDYITTSGTDLPPSGYLGDNLISHVHGYGPAHYNVNGDGFPQGGGKAATTGNVASSDSDIGGAETRPKNITAVYYLVAEGDY